MAERVLAELVALVPGGVEEEHGRTYVEYAIYGEPGEVPALPTLEAAAGEGLVHIETTEVPDDWGDRWRDFHRPIEIDGRLVVRPSWSASRRGTSAGRRDDPERTPDREEGEVSALETDDVESQWPIEIVIDPGQAFGTGSHATTRMCLALLLRLADDGAAHGHLADLGTGSGVLAIAASKLGWGLVEGCDHEAAALEAASTNAGANGVHLRLRRINLRDDEPPVAPTLVANLTARLLRRVAAHLRSARTRPARVVCSGLLEPEADEVLAAFGHAGLQERDRMVEGEWVALLLEPT